MPRTRTYGLNNPLARLEPVELRAVSDAFADEVGPTADKELFWRAAKAAQDPQEASTIEGLNQHEKQALESEKNGQGFFAQSRVLKTSIAAMCFSAMIQGWAQTGSNGSNQDWPHEFGLIDPATGVFKDRRSVWVFATINALPYLAASLGGCWLSDPLQSMLLGRRGAIFVSGFVCMAALIGAACTRNWQQLMACRAILGIGLGAKASTTPIFSAEMSPSHLRGALVMNWQFFVTVGIFAGFTANLILYRIGALVWRLQIVSACIPTLILLVLIFTIPESPRWLLKRGKYGQAFAAMIPLRETRLQAARDILYANQQLQAEELYLHNQDVRDEEESDSEPYHDESSDEEGEDEADFNRRDNLTTESDLGITPDQASATQRSRSHGLPPQDALQSQIRRSDYFHRLRQLFQNPRTRRATIASASVMIGQQLCGINVLAFYSSTFFRDVNGVGGVQGSAAQAVWFSWGVGISNCLFTLPAYWYIDNLGRRLLLLATQPFMTIFMFCACLSFLATNPEIRLVLIGVFLFLFIAAYSIGQGPVAFAYSSEAFPLIYREVGMSFAVFVNMLGAGLLTLFVPLAQLSGSGTRHIEEHAYAIGQTKLLGCFVGLNILSILLNFCFVRETQGTLFRQEEQSLIYLSLEELNRVFDVTTFYHLAYQWEQVTPFPFKWLAYHLRLRTMKRPDKPEDFFSWVESARKANEELAAEARTTEMTITCRHCRRTAFEYFERDSQRLLRCCRCERVARFNIQGPLEE